MADWGTGGKSDTLEFLTDLICDDIEVIWKFKDFQTLRQVAQKNRDKGLCISPAFKDSDDRKWLLKLYPNECRNNKSGSVSMFLYCYNSRQSVQSCFDFEVAVLDQDGQTIEGIGGGANCVELRNERPVQNWGLYELIPSARAAGLEEFTVRLKLKVWLQTVTKLCSGS